MGRGLIQPFQRDLNDFAVADGKKQFKSKIEQILGTRGTTRGRSLGELPWRPEFGSGLHVLRHGAMFDEAGDDMARTYVGDALRRWLPGSHVSGLEITNDPEGGSKIIRVGVTSGTKGERGVVAEVPVPGE